MNDDELRGEAIKRVRAKREFRQHLGVYVIVNLALIGIWAATGADYFWPVWPILGWGLGLLFHGYSVFWQRPITEDEIQREMRRGG